MSSTDRVITSTRQRPRRHQSWAHFGGCPTAIETFQLGEGKDPSGTLFLPLLRVLAASNISWTWAGWGTLHFVSRRYQAHTGVSRRWGYTIGADKETKMVHILFFSPFHIVCLRIHGGFACAPEQKLRHRFGWSFLLGFGLKGIFIKASIYRQQRFYHVPPTLLLLLLQYQRGS